MAHTRVEKPHRSWSNMNEGVGLCDVNPTEQCREALMSLLCASERLPSNAAARSCDHLAHSYGNAVGHRDRERRYPSDNVGRGMGGRPASAAGAGLALGEGRIARGSLSPAAAGRDPSPGHGRDLVAGDARGLSRLGSGPRLLPPLARARADHRLPRPAAREVREREGREAGPTAGASTRSRCGPPRRCRQPHAVTTAARRCRAANGTS